MSVRFVQAGLAAAALLALCPTLRAQTVAIAAFVERRPDRGNLSPLLINRDDCLADDTLGLALVFAGAGELGLEMWSGTSSSCASPQFRASLVPTLCWLVKSLAVAQSELLSVRVQDLLPHEASGEDTGTTEVCESRGQGSLSLFTSLVAGDNQVGTPATLALKYDLRAPSAPTNVRLQIGDTRLFASFAPSIEADVKSYLFACEATHADANAPEGCRPPTLKSGEPPPPALIVGMTSTSSTNGEASNLENYRQYACGVAARDAAGNLGPLSELACAVPAPLAPLVGRGGCNFASLRVGNAGASLLPLGLAFLLRWKRRARLRRRP